MLCSDCTLEVFTLVDKITHFPFFYCKSKHIPQQKDTKICLYSPVFPILTNRITPQSLYASRIYLISEIISIEKDEFLRCEIARLHLFPPINLIHKVFKLNLTIESFLHEVSIVMKSSVGKLNGNEEGCVVECETWKYIGISLTSFSSRFAWFLWDCFRLLRGICILLFPFHSIVIDILDPW